MALLKKFVKRVLTILAHNNNSNNNNSQLISMKTQDM